MQASSRFGCEQIRNQPTIATVDAFCLFEVKYNWKRETHGAAGVEYMFGSVLKTSQKII